MTSPLPTITYRLVLAGVHESIDIALCNCVPVESVTNQQSHFRAGFAQGIRRLDLRATDETLVVHLENAHADVQDAGRGRRAVGRHLQVDNREWIAWEEDDLPVR